MSLQFDTRPAAYGVIIHNGSILLAYWKHKGREAWTLPGGGLDVGEHPVDGCRREVFEETGYHTSIGPMLGVDVHVWSSAERPAAGWTDTDTNGVDEPEDESGDGPAAGRPLEALRLIYQATITGGELTHEVNGTTTHAAWFKLSEVDSLNRLPLVDAGIRLHEERPPNGLLRSSRQPQQSHG
ncbi:NUDIX hydrolase [Arthrobacter sp. M4]|uniref:NUDIX hydrolase n=1 Tax=Arthrobacter sp. M4 TaxID=218160 RepID=UPI001CDBB7E8|nr:NUDIX domain-containing protein [Arthrobacter sp. M4]MCA4132402.1 NUDIX domain-containing protein [Arthrobacter sp. M4]